MSNKYVYGIEQVHLATYEEALGVVTFDTPVPYPGATELTMDARGEIVEEYADNTLWVAEAVNNGYDVTLSMKSITDYFEREILGKTKNADGVIIETNNDRGKKFALMFQFQGDQKNVRYVLYNCSATRPSTSSSTREATFASQTQEITVIASGIKLPGSEKLIIRANTTPDGNEAVYTSWFQAVHVPTFDAPVEPEVVA